MKTASRTLLITGLLLGIAQAASAQTADEIVERHIAAIGGRAALTKLTSRSNTGTITLTTPVGDLTGPLELISGDIAVPLQRVDHVAGLAIEPLIDGHLARPDAGQIRE